MRAETFLKNNMTDERFDLKIDWETAGKPTAHPFIYMLMETYAKQVNDAKTEKDICPYCGTEKENPKDDICVDCWQKYRNP